MAVTARELEASTWSGSGPGVTVAELAEETGVSMHRDGSQRRLQP